MDKILIQLGVALVILGLVAAVLGVIMSFVGARGGRLLPGDVVVSRPGFVFAFPIVTSIVISLVLTLILWALGAWRR